MSFPLNPQALNGPNWSSNYTQADYRVPVVSAQVSTFAVGTDVMGNDFVTPPNHYQQPGINGTYPF
jgi:hypothetical protein